MFVKKTDIFFRIFNEKNCVKNYSNIINSKNLNWNFKFQKHFKKWISLIYKNVNLLKRQLIFKNRNIYNKKFVLKTTFSKIRLIHSNKTNFKNDLRNVTF